MQTNRNVMTMSRQRNNVAGKTLTKSLKFLGIHFTLILSKMMKKRLMKEFMNFRNEATEGCWATPVDDLLHWSAIVEGPPGTPYENGKFELDVRIGEKYPYEAPNIRFVTKVYHPNIAEGTGAICLDLLKNRWSPAMTLNKTLLCIRSLLEDPNPDDPLNQRAANLYKSDRAQFDQKVREMITG
jgi:ubiquitin-protein ligase